MLALVEPLAVAWHAVKISPFKQGDSVLILGGGPIGLAVIQALQAKGAGQIIVSEVAPRRKEFAKEFGAHYVLDPTKEDIVARVRELCDGQGAHLAFDATGVQVGVSGRFPPNLLIILSLERSCVISGRPWIPARALLVVRGYR